MIELSRIVDEPRRCSYLPRETAALEYRNVWDLQPEDFRGLLERGYRRFGSYLFRPACPSCVQCRSLRVLPDRFFLTKSLRRVMESNRRIEAQRQPLFVTKEHVALYNRYHRFMHEHRGWPSETVTLDSFAESFIAGGREIGWQWLYFEDNRLVGVALVDEVPGAISLVYCFYEPEWRPQSPGTFSILTQINYARSNGLTYVYLGYWIAACQSMNYKVRFRPHEILREYPTKYQLPVWDEVR